MLTIPLRSDGSLRVEETRSRPGFDSTQRPWWRAAVRSDAATWTADAAGWKL